jgi:hypothetical protein
MYGFSEAACFAARRPVRAGARIRELRRRGDDHRLVIVVGRRPAGGRDCSIVGSVEFAGRFEDAVAGHVFDPRCDAVAGPVLGSRCDAGPDARRKRGRRIDSPPGGD